MEIILDSSDSTINQGYGINEWSQADLKVFLNEDYYNHLETNNMVSQILWNTGANGYQKLDQIDPKKFYTIERSNFTGKICSGGDFCNDNVVRTTSHFANVGLLYLSDYAFSTVGGSTTSRTECLSTFISAWNNFSDCYENS